MPEIKNELSWSFSRQRIFNECLREYFYHYYLSWEGWNRTAAVESQKAYLLKNITTLDQWAGQIVHEVIRMIFNRYQRYDEWLALEKAQKIASNLVDVGWKQSIEKRWQERIKGNLNLFEHYYNLLILPERIEQIKEKIEVCLREFLNSKLFDFIKKIDSSDWLEIPRPAQSFIWENIKIWVSFDFGLRTSGKIYIYDFKTGKPSPAENLQFLCYALHAQQQEPDLSKIKVFPVYLYPQFLLDDSLPLSLSLIEKTKSLIKESYNKMQSLLDDPEKNLASLKNFPLTEEDWRCRRCIFQEICI